MKFAKKRIRESRTLSDNNNNNDKVEELEELNQTLRNRDKIKDDAIAQLSDQVIALTARMQEFERRQQPYVS